MFNHFRIIDDDNFPVRQNLIITVVKRPSIEKPCGTFLALCYVHGLFVHPTQASTICKSAMDKLIAKCLPAEV